MTEALRSGTLTATKGTATRRFEARFAELTGAAHVLVCAVGQRCGPLRRRRRRPGAGRRDRHHVHHRHGSADADPLPGRHPRVRRRRPGTGNVTAETHRRPASPTAPGRVVVTHLFGNPCDMDPDHGARRRATASPSSRTPPRRSLATDRRPSRGHHRHGRLLQLPAGQARDHRRGRHRHDRTTLRSPRRMRLFVNKAWPYGESGPGPRVPGAQLPPHRAAGRRRPGAARQARGVGRHPPGQRRRPHRRLAAAGLPGITVPGDPDHGTHAYWRYCLSVDPEVVPGGNVALGAALRERGIATAPRYIQKPAFACKVISGPGHLRRQPAGRSRRPAPRRSTTRPSCSPAPTASSTPCSSSRGTSGYEADGTWTTSPPPPSRPSRRCWPSV